MRGWTTAGAAVLALAGAAQALPVPRPAAPAGGAATVVFHPTLSWELPFSDELSVHVQLAADAGFGAVVDEDRIHSVVDWYVPAKRLAPGTYWWRLRCVHDDGRAGGWSAARRLSIVEPQEVFAVAPATPLEELRRIGARAARADSALIRFETGTYRFKPGFEETVFEWEGAENIVLDGGGSRFVMEEPSAQLWRAVGCRNLLVGNFSYEYDPRPHTIARVAGTDAANGTLDAEYMEGFSEARYPRVVNQMFAYALDPADPRRLHPDRPGHLYLDPEKTIKTGERRVRYAMAHQNEFPWLEEMRAGDLIAVCYRRWPVGYVQRCTDFTLFNIVLSRSEAPFFMGGGNTDMKFLHLESPSEKGLYPSPAGWVTGNDRHGPWIEGCFFEAIADDGPNITGNAYLVEEAGRDGLLVMQTGPGWQNPVWRKGDRLVFWNPVDGLPVANVAIAEVLTDARALKRGRQSVRLAQPVAGLRPGPDMAVHTHVYNRSCQNSGFVARHNRMVCGRRFGFNIKANNVLVEKNHFEGLSSSAVYLENAPTFWEGLACENVVVQENTMVNCGNSVDSARRRRASGVHVNLWRHPSKGGYATPWIGHQNLLIRNNTLVDWESVGIAVDNVRNARVLGNRFASQDKAGFLLDENFAVWEGVDAGEITVRGSAFSDQRTFRKHIRKQLD